MLPGRLNWMLTLVWHSPAHSQPYLTPLNSKSTWVRGDKNIGITWTSLVAPVMMMLGLVRPSRKSGVGEGSWILRTRRYQREQFLKWSPWTFQGVCDAKPIFITTFRVCWPSCHFYLLIFSVDICTDEAREWGSNFWHLGASQNHGPQLLWWSVYSLMPCTHHKNNTYFT